MAPGPALMVAKRGPTPKNKDKNCKEQGPSRCFWPRAPQSLEPLLAPFTRFICAHCSVYGYYSVHMSQ